MISIALAVLTGTLVLQLLPALPPAPLTGFLAPATVLLAAIRHTRLMAWCAVGFLSAWGQAAWRLADDLPAALEGGDLVLTGAIVSLPERDGRATRFLFRSQQRQEGAGWVAFTRTLRLSWYDAPPLAAGGGWQLRVRLKRRQGFFNPGGFDYSGWLFQRGIAATGYVRAGAGTAPHPAAASRHPGVRLRAAVDARLERALSGARQTGLLRALAIGDDDALPAEQWRVLRATGTGHLVAISGLHIGLVAGLGFAVGRAAWARSHRLTLRFPAPVAGAALAIVFSTLYAMLAGFDVPARRAWIMVMVFMAGVLTRRATRPLQGLAVALLAVTLFDPFAALSPGFWLSFAAVGIIFALLAQSGVPLEGPFAGLRTRIRTLVRMQGALSLGLLPLLLMFFGQFGWVAPLANLFAVPWTSLLLVPRVFAGLVLLYPAPWLAHWVLACAGWAGQALDNVLRAFAALPGALVGMPAAPASVRVAALAGVVLLFLPRGTPHRLLGVLLLVPLVAWSPPRPGEGVAWFSLLDVGQGLAAVVQTRRHVLVYDAGPRFSPDFDTGDAVVAPFLESIGVRRIDRLVISHGDNDHRGGAASLDARVPAFKVLTSVPELLEWRYATRCRAGQAWDWDGVRFEMLFPETDGALRGNDGSCVLRVVANGEALLLPGDIEAAAERALVTRYGAALRSEVLVAPHHGSRTSSTTAFVQAVAPRRVLFAAGYRNRYGFPRPQVLARYRAHASETWITAESGAIQLRLGAGDPAALPLAERQRARRYWHLPATVPPSP